MLVGTFLPANSSQSITSTAPKSQFDTLSCTLEELAVIMVIGEILKLPRPRLLTLKKSASTVKRITSTLVEKGIIIRRNGRRNGWWEIKKF